MFKRASSKLVRTSSKDSKDSDVSVNISDALVRIGRATKKGQMHPNEDRCSVLETLNESLDEEVVTVSEMLEFDLKNSGDLLEKVMYAGVFDGHGGSGCSSYVARSLHAKLAKCLESNGSESLLDSQAYAGVIKAFLETEDDYQKYAAETNDTSGSCAAIALIAGKDVLIAHAGDCRIVLRSLGETVAVTKDHRADEPGEMSRITSSGGTVVSGRINGVLSPSRGFGDSDVKSQCPEDVLIVKPDVARYCVDVGALGKFSSFMVIATDGLWDVMEVDDVCSFVEKALRKTGSAEMAASRLVDTASRNSHDDVTVVVIAWQRVKPKAGDSKANVRALSTEQSREEDSDMDLLASPKIKRKNYDPDSKIKPQ